MTLVGLIFNLLAAGLSFFNPEQSLRLFLLFLLFLGVSTLAYCLALVLTVMLILRRSVTSWRLVYSRSAYLVTTNRYTQQQWFARLAQRLTLIIILLISFVLLDFINNHARNASIETEMSLNALLLPIAIFAILLIERLFRPRPPVTAPELSPAARQPEELGR